ncbi:MAG: efflux RND transporter periplasmic adaptor subunit [Verrucomicrobia bacterium]|nr:efflux RND transporter periplasmic adaptor subunit [Verrucomicrobiota bacterium]
MLSCLIALLGVLELRSANEHTLAPTAKDSAVPITVGKVELIPLDRTLPIIGTLFAKDEATVAAEVEGKVEKTMAEFGDRLQAGQEIALIDTSSYEVLTHQTAANLAKAQASVANANQSLKRVEELRKNNIASMSDWDKATADAEQARADVKGAEAAHEIALLNLKRSRVTAPFDSAVADRIASAGDYVKIGAPLFRIVNDGVLKFITQAPESFAGEVKKEQLVVFNVDAYPGQDFEGKVFLVSPQVNTGNRSFAFGALVQNTERKLKASSFARGKLILERRVPTMMAPLEAIQNFAGVTKAFVVESGIAQARQVRVGRIIEGRQEILSGLKAGETVVLTGQTKLHEGAKVRIKEAALSSK